MRPLLITLLAVAFAVAGISSVAPVRAQSLTTPVPAAPSAIPPISWNLIEFPGVGPMTQQGLYSVQFLEDGQVSARADCNWVGGLWTAANGVLDITVTQTSLALCPEGSLEKPYVQALHDATGYFVDGFALTISGPSGDMRFAPAMPAVA